MRPVVVIQFEINWRLAWCVVSKQTEGNQHTPPRWAVYSWGRSMSAGPTVSAVHGHLHLSPRERGVEVCCPAEDEQRQYDITLWICYVFGVQYDGSEPSRLVSPASDSATRRK